MEQFNRNYAEVESLIELNKEILAISGAENLAHIVDSLRDGNGNLKLEKFTISESHGVVTIVYSQGSESFTFASSVSPINEVTDEFHRLVKLLIIQKSFIMQFDQICAYDNDDLYCRCISAIYAVAEAMKCNISPELLNIAGKEYTTHGSIGKENVLYITIMLHMITMTMQDLMENKEPASIAEKVIKLKDAYGINDEYYMNLFHFIMRNGKLSDKINDAIKEQVFNHLFQENKDVSMMLMVFQIYCRGRGLRPLTPEVL